MQKVSETQMSLLSKQRSGQQSDFSSLTYHSLYLRKITRSTLYILTMFCAMFHTGRRCLPISFVSSSRAGDSIQRCTCDWRARFARGDCDKERLIKQAGFKLLEARDTTENAATLSKRWHDSRDKRKAALVAMETKANFIGLQRFLACVHSLTSERRLLRFLYVMEK
jgi:hypothetical protein